MTRPRSKHHVVLGGGNGSGNHGDEGMWLALVRSLRRLDPDAALVTGGSTDWVAPIPDVEVLPMIHQSVKRVSTVPRSKFHAAGYLLINRGALERGIRRCAELFGGASVRPGLESTWDDRVSRSRSVIFAGAGGLTDAYALHAIVGWGMLTALAARHGVPVAYFGHGVGPLKRTDLRRCFARTLDDVSMFTTRDVRSETLVRDLSARVDVEAAPDWAMMLEPSRQDRAEADEIVRHAAGNSSFVALSIRSYQSESPDLQAQMDAIVPRLVDIAVGRGQQVMFVPTCIGAGGRSQGDTPHHHRLRASLPTSVQERVHVVDQRASAEVTRALLGRSTGVFANRYHSVVFAQAEGVPATALALDSYYRSKMTGALRWYGEEERAIDLRAEVSDGQLAAGIDPGNTTKTYRLEQTAELMKRCETPFVSWFQGLA